MTLLVKILQGVLLVGVTLAAVIGVLVVGAHLRVGQYLHDHVDTQTDPRSRRPWF